MSVRVAIVTGAAQGIGYAIAVRLAHDGLNIAVNDVASKSDKIDAVVSEIKALGREAVAVPADVSSETEVKDMIARTVAALGSVDVMVANAGIIVAKPFLKTTMEEYDRVMSVNARGIFNCYQSAANQMIAQGRGGHIIGACSVAGMKGGPATSVYGMSKFAIRGLTQTVAQELKPHNISVNAYAPGAVITELLRTGSMIPPSMPEEDVLPFLKKAYGLGEKIPFTQPDKIASVVSFLASVDASFINGQTIIADGGVVFS